MVDQAFMAILDKLPKEIEGLNIEEVRFFLKKKIKGYT